MAMAKVKCTCSACGKEFTVKRDCFSRKDADSFEAWAAQHFTLCRDCYTAEIKDDCKTKAEAIISKYNLPEIKGVSEKQINYATELRNRFLTSVTDDQLTNATNFDALCQADNGKKIINDLAAQKHDGDINKARAEILRDADLFELYTLLSESNAGKIIELLR